MTSRMVGEEAFATDSAHGDREPVLIDVHYTLCTTSPELKAVSCVGRRVIQGDQRDAVVLSTNQVTAELETATEVFSLGPDMQPEPIWTTLPVAAQVLAALANARLSIGWSGVTVGSGAYADLLAGMASHLGAREPVQLQTTDMASIAAVDGVAPVFFSVGLGNRDLDELMRAVPERSMIILLDDVSSPSIPVDFYDTIHRKSLGVITPTARPSAAHYARARRLVAMRLAPGYESPPVHVVAGGQHAHPPDSPTVILQWR